MANTDREAIIATSMPHPYVSLIELNRPSKRNALSHAVIEDLLEALEKASKNVDTRVIVLTGSNKVFSSGADLKEIAGLGTVEARNIRYLENLNGGIRSVTKPIIAAIEGMALGGGFELALMCDIIVSASDAIFGFPEINVGLIPGAGGTQRLTSIVGKYKAMAMILSGDTIRADEAERLRLVSSVVESGTARGNALALAVRLAGNSRSASAAAIQAINRANDKGMDLTFESDLYWDLFSSADKTEGVEAFLQKRKPVWSVADHVEVGETPAARKLGTGANF